MKYKVLAIVMTLSFNSFAGSSYSNKTENSSTPEGYDKLSACEKQDVLWNKIKETEHKELPAYSKLGFFQILGLVAQPLIYKVEEYSDFSPKGWKKYIHKRGSVAKVKFNSIGDHPYTGVFKGAECALLRLSVTYEPVEEKDIKVRDHSKKGHRYKYIKGKGKPLAPGLALKFLRDEIPSANVSALYTLSGQGQDYNFFRHPLSNIVPRGSSIGEKIVHKIFSKVTRYPEELKMKNMARSTSKGEKESKPIEPRQIFFVPNSELNFSKDFHDVRNDFVTLKLNTVLYEVYALPTSDKYKNYSQYKIEDIPKYRKQAQLIGEITLASKFIASEFGDLRLFFKHDIQEQ